MRDATIREAVVELASAHTLEDSVLIAHLTLALSSIARRLDDIDERLESIERRVTNDA